MTWPRNVSPGLRVACPGDADRETRPPDSSGKPGGTLLVSRPEESPDPNKQPPVRRRAGRAVGGVRGKSGSSTKFNRTAFLSAIEILDKPPIQPQFWL